VAIKPIWFLHFPQDCVSIECTALKALPPRSDVFGIHSIAMQQIDESSVILLDILTFRLTTSFRDAGRVSMSPIQKLPLGRTPHAVSMSTV